MQVPDVPIDPQNVINEYHSRLSNATAANIRLTLVIQALTSQRDDALNRWQEADTNSKLWEKRYSDLENGTASTTVERRFPS